MTADPWDLPTITHEPTLTMDDVDRIRELIQERRFDDPALFPSLHWIGFAALCSLALEGNPVAASALRVIERRTDFGGPLPDFPRGAVV